MILKDIVKDIVVRHTTESDIFLVDVKLGGDSKIFVEIDSPQGVTVDDCAKISRAIEASLDRDSEDFELEVSSPGLTQPFKVLEQYRKNFGRQVSLVMFDGEKINGVLQNADNDGVLVEVATKIREAGQKRPKIVTQPVSIKFNDIKATKLALTF